MLLCAKKRNLTSQCLLTNNAAKHHPIVKDDGCVHNFPADMSTMMVVELYLFSADVECQNCPNFPIKFRRNNCLILFQKPIFTSQKAVKKKKKALHALEVNSECHG
jgi:hypothetical protein